MRRNLPLIIKTVLVFILLFIILVTGSKAWKDYEVTQDQKKLEAMYSQILDGAATSPLTIQVDYNKKISNGSPLIFGGNHAPDLSHQDAWNKIQEIGMTSIRKDFFIDKALPPNITLEEYKKNLGGIADPKNWNTDEISKVKGTFENSRKRGMKNIGIVCYNPPWLTYNNKSNGVPKDWVVYEDLVKKAYKMYRNDVDYLEIWNEPNWDIFFDVKNSGLSVEEAYTKMYYHAVKAIREVDAEANDGKIMPIGGPVGSDVLHTSILDHLLKYGTVNKDETINFISYHNYETKYNIKEPSWKYYKEVLNNNNFDKPIFITEWNYDPSESKPSRRNTGTPAILYTSNKFIDYLRMGLAGANYHVIEPLDLKKPNEGEGYMGFYRLKNNVAELLPQAKTWRLMSNKMKLGKGESLIYDLSTEDKDLNGVGFKNVAGQYGLVVTNNSGSSKLSTINLSGLGIGKYAKVEIYYASADNDATTPVYSGEIKGDEKNMKLIVYLPKESVVGVTLSPEKNWYDFLNLPY